MSSQTIIENMADKLLEVCGDEDELVALIENILRYIKEQNDDEDWSPTIDDIKNANQDTADDIRLEKDTTDEEIEIREVEPHLYALK